MQLPGLSFAQRQVLITLAKKGLVLKFFAKGGVYYLAIPAHLDKKVKLEVNRLIAEQIGHVDAGELTTPTTSTTSTASTTTQ